MPCPNCGAENRPGRRFCAQCAAPLALACTGCGAPYEPGDRFCGECARPLTSSGTGAAAVPSGPARPVPPVSVPPNLAPVAERRVVTVLFADLVGFTPFAEERDPEEVRETLSRYFDIARDVVEKYGGTVEKFIGDAVMALWGAPVAQEDDAERAVRAGLELVVAVRVLGPGITARAGVLTGEAAVTLGAVNQGMVAGDLVNTAARLQGIAAPGSVVVGEPTMRAASGAIVFEALGEQDLKGKHVPVAAHRALRVVAERGGRNRSEALEAPFVGRDEELRQLRDLFHTTSREGRARLVSVVGPAGIGKSRLAWEFLKYIDGLVEAVWWHAGRSPAYGSGISFWPLGEMVRARAGLAETDDERTTRDKVAAMVAEHVPSPDERRWIEPAMLALLGIEAGAGPEQLFAAWRTFFERLAASGPVVMAFEDLHWADPGTLDFIDHLLEWSRNVPIYVLTLARPELVDRRPDWGAGKRAFTSIFLEPLPEPAMRDLLLGLVPGLPETSVRTIVERADGIPLYAVETVRMLLADGRLRLADGVYVPAGDLSRLAIPETLTALIGARLDGLEAADRALVQDAAVLGQSFTPAGLAAVSGLDADDLEQRLRPLVRRELLTVEADPRSPERGQYSFVQALIREVAYNTLAHRDRKARHLAAARFFEGLGTDELAGALAGHYLAAHELAPAGPEAEALAGQARLALRGAADRALGLGAHDQAVGFLTQALSVTDGAVDRADLLGRIGESETISGHHELAEHHLRDAVAGWRATGERERVALATASLVSALLNAYQPDVALEVIAAAADEFADLAGSEGYTAILGQLARTHFLRGDMRAAVAVSDRVLEAAEHANMIGLVADTLVTKGTALVSIGRVREGFALLNGGLETAQRHRVTAVATRAFINSSFTGLVHDPREALAVGRTGLDFAGRIGRRSDAIFILGNAAVAALRVGEWDWIATEVPEALGHDMAAGDRVVLLEAMIALGALRGDPVDPALAEIEAVSGAATDIQQQAAAHSSRGYVALPGGRFDVAVAAWRTAGDLNVGGVAIMLALAGHAALLGRDLDAARSARAALEATGIHGPAPDADRLALDAGIAALAGRPDEALGFYRQAARAYQDLGLQWDEALAGLEAAVLLDPGSEAVRTIADRTRATLQRLRAVPMLAQLDAALDRDSAGSSDADSRPVEVEAR